MTSSEAFEYGIIASGPFLLFSGLFFALSITASPYHHLLGKAIAWPTSPIVGLVFGAYLAGKFLPEWSDWIGVAWFFGVGHFVSWMIIGLLSHDDLTHNYGDWCNALKDALVRRIKRQKRSKPIVGRNYQARAATRQRDEDS